MKPKFLLLVLPFILIASHARAEPWWENSLIKQTLTEKSIDQEVCGSGIDEDGVGGDAPCPGGDSDLDGYADDVDCEPFNKFIYSEISTTCDINGGTANGWKTCQDDGTFTACVDSAAQPLCEAQGSGHCYYFDPLHGNNSNDGSYKHPWKDYEKITSENPDRYRPVPGDIFYFMSGTYKAYIDPQDSEVKNLTLAHFGKLNDHPIIFKNYPGEHPLFENSKVTNNIIGVFEHIVLYNVKNIIIEGLHVTQKPDNYSSNTIFTSLGEKHIYRNLYLHDVRDNDIGDLTSCIFLFFSGSSEIRTSIMHDCYKTVDSGNIGEIFMTSLKQGKTLIKYNTVFIGKNFTLPVGSRSIGSPALISTKHGSLESNVELEIAYNVLYSPIINGAAIGTGQYNSFIHNNIIFNKAEALGVYDGGTGNYCYYCNIKFENNTAINSSAFSAHPPSWHGQYDPAIRNVPNPTSCNSALGSLYFNNNIITHSSRPIVFGDVKFINLYVYVPDRFYEEFIMGNNLKIDNNIYYSTTTDLKTNPYAISLFGSNSAPERAKYGKIYSLNQWQTDTTSKPYKYDVNSFVEDPLLKTSDGSFMPLNPNAADKGWLAGAVLTPTIWDVDNNKKWSLPDVIYGLEVLSGKRK
jgi:hypothetical protein